MLLPFQRKTFVTSLNVDEAKSAVRAIMNERVKFSLLFFNKYSGSMEGKTFKIWRGQQLLMPAIKGVIRPETPTVVELKLVPSYLIMAFFALFALISAPIAFNADEMTINGIKRVPEITERIFFALMVTVAPAIIFFFNSIVQSMGLERRLKEGLMLRRVRE